MEADLNTSFIVQDDDQVENMELSESESVQEEADMSQKSNKTATSSESAQDPEKSMFSIAEQVRKELADLKATVARGIRLKRK